MSKTPKIETDAPVLEHDDLEWDLFWHRNKTLILGGAAAVVVGLVGFFGWQISTKASEEAAATMLAKASDATQWQEVIQKYPRSAPAADAYFQLAAALRDQGKWEESNATFQKFLDVFPNHQLAGGALYGIGQNFDFAGKNAEAINAYQQVTAKYPKSYAAPFAAFSQAEILLRDFRSDEARTVLESITTQYPQSMLARLASSRLSRLKSSAEPVAVGL